MPEIRREALGRVAKIGALYDIRAEKFTADTLFKSKLPDDELDSTELGRSSMELTMTDSIQEKFEKLSIDAELQVSVLSGMLELSGSGSYLKEERKSARAQSMSLLYKVRTVEQEIMMRQHKDLIDRDIFDDESIDSTHVVFAIDWGAVCYATCEDENEEDKDVTKVREALKAEVTKLKGLIDIEASEEGSYDYENEQNNTAFTFKCFTDVFPPDKDLPTTFAGALDLARKLPELMKGKNDGKGVPLSFTMIPLETVIKMCKLPTQNAVRYTVIDDDIAMKCVHVVKEITKTKQALYDIQNDLKSHPDYVDKKSINKIQDLLQKFLKDESSFKETLQDLVSKVRSCNEDISVLEKFLDKALSDTVNLAWYNDQMKGLQKDTNRVKSVKSYKRKGICYIGKHDAVTLPGETAVDGSFVFHDQVRDLEGDISKAESVEEYNRKGITFVGKHDAVSNIPGKAVADKRHVFLLYKSSEEDSKNEDLFLRLHSTHVTDDDNKFIVIDKDVRKDLWAAGEKKTAIHKYVDGSRQSSDLFSDEGKDFDMCLVQISDPKRNQVRPKKWAYVKLRCPNALAGSGQCSGNQYIWMCSKCKENIEYGTETKCFHCACGESDPKLARFRCSERDHGMDYTSYLDDNLSSGLSNLPAVKEKNILILGETGVGKSTWINGLVNYLYFSDLKDAVHSNDFQVMIPSSFTFTQEGKEKTILVGETDANETMEAGKSATKEPRTYKFFVDGEVVRLIDTPGVGGSDGLKQNEKNFDNILQYLKHYNEIHAVCILLKPNNARLTAMFRFCIQEVLAHLHSTAKHNIVFCFTHARATFYQPGDTLPNLNKVLKDKNVGIQATSANYFCFDNEPFRCLACLKNGVKFSELEMDTYSESWNKSVEETKRLIAQIDTLAPHQVRDTLSMNEARRVIVAMSKPSVEVTKTIQQNVQEGNDAKAQIDLIDEDMDSMKDKLKFAGYNLNRTELEYPQTVCADEACGKYYPIGERQIQNRVYEQVCHNPCLCVSGISVETTNDPRLQNCACIGKDNNCIACGHHYTKHMHITHNLEIFETEFISKEVQKAINEKESVKKHKGIVFIKIDEKNAQLEEERDIIMKTSAKYGSFLKSNAIIPCNDAVEDYLDVIINQERSKVNAIRNGPLLKTMETIKCEYEEQKRILDAAIGQNTGENIHSAEEVMKLQEQLFRLKHFGETLKKLFEGISISQLARNVALQETTASFPQRKKTSAADVETAHKSANIPENTRNCIELKRTVAMDVASTVAKDVAMGVASAFIPVPLLGLVAGAVVGAVSGAVAGTVAGIRTVAPFRSDQTK